MHFRFITSTPLTIARGSGTYTGITTLAKFLRESGHTVDLITPGIKLPVHTAERIVFNERFRFQPADRNAVTVGFDMDGYSLPRVGFHIASIKGVIADEMRFERGLTHATMRIQAHHEKLHVQRADLVIAPSQYSAARIQELYGISTKPRVVPEPIDLAQWRRLLTENVSPPEEGKFIVLCVCRFYPRKRLPVLLSAGCRLRARIPGLEVRLVGGGPETARLKAIAREKRLDGSVTWLGNVSQSELAREYNRCHVFCMASVQESFGIVFLEAMAAGKPIVASRAASVPEVVKYGVLVEPDSDEALAEGIERLYKDPALRAALVDESRRWVEQFDGPLVAAQFMNALGS
jgi:glycosyltransferase involved in cell wall biosynthesis